jgi:hypothetical protein
MVNHSTVWNLNAAQIHSLRLDYMCDVSLRNDDKKVFFTVKKQHLREEFKFFQPPMHHLTTTPLFAKCLDIYKKNVSIDITLQVNNSPSNHLTYSFCSFQSM